MVMYNIHDALPYNCKDVAVKTVSGHKCTGRCHVYSEFEDDRDVPDEYITIDGGTCIDLADIAEITEIGG